MLQGGRREGLMEPLPGFIDLLRYFETIYPLVEILWSSQQDEVYFMVGSAAGGPVASPTMNAILDFTKN